MVNFEAFRWNFSSSTNLKIGRSDFIFLLIFNAYIFFLASDNYSGGGWAPVSSNNGWGYGSNQAVPYNSGNVGFGVGGWFNKILYGIILLLAITSVGQVCFIHII